MKAVGPLVGYVMRETKGRADGGEVTRLIRAQLGSRSGALTALVTRCYKPPRIGHTQCMAWNVVIAGGGFAGMSAARELERLLPKQSARLILVNDVNFMLYTPFLPEAAAGTLEPRHVVTPLRDILRRTDLRLGAVSGHDPETRTLELTTHEGEDETLRYDQFLVAVGSVSRSLPVPGLDRHAIGFKSLADAIWLRNHVVETLERANATDDPARREELLTYVFVGGGYSGLEALAELQDFAADAIDRYPRARLHGMRWILVEATDRVLPEVDQGLADYAVRELRGRGIDIRLGTMLDEANEDSARLSTGETIPTKTIVWTAGVAPHPSLKHLRCRSTTAGKVEVDEYMRVRGLEGVWAIGDCAAVPDPDKGRRWRPRRRPSTRSARARPSPTTSPASWAWQRRRARFDYQAKAAFVNLGRYKAVGQLGKRRFSGFPAWWLARTYHMSQIPGVSRKIRAVADWTVGLPFSRDVAEVGSIGHPRPLARRGLRARRHPPAGGLRRDGGRSRPRRLRPRHGRHRQGQGQFVLPLVPDRVPAARDRDHRRPRLPLRAPRARAPLPPLRQRPEALRPGLQRLRRGPLPAGGRVRGPHAGDDRGGAAGAARGTVETTDGAGRAASQRPPTAARRLAQPGAGDRVGEAHPVAHNRRLLRVAV